MDTKTAELILEDLFLTRAIARANEMDTRDSRAAEAVQKELNERRNRMLVEAFGVPKKEAVIAEVLAVAA